MQPNKDLVPSPPSLEWRQALFERYLFRGLVLGVQLAYKSFKYPSSLLQLTSQVIQLVL